MVGTRLGPFEIRERVDIPGLPEVYAARDSHNDRDVFIHVLRTFTAHDEAVRDQFEQDVRAAAARIQQQPPIIHLIGVDAQAVYVVSDPVRETPAPAAVPAVTPAAQETAVTRGARGPRHGKIAALAILAAIAFGIVLAMGGDEDRADPARPQAANAPSASVQPPLPSAPPVSAVSDEPIVLSERDALDDVAIEPPRRADPVAPPPAPERIIPPPTVTPPAVAAVPPARVESATETPRPPVSAPTPPPQPVADSRSPATLVTEATVRAAEFDLEGALTLLEAAAGREDVFARIGMLYLRGVIMARDAFRTGGSGDALKPVQESVTALNGIGKGRPGSAEIARLMLRAAMAAAQTERDEMRLYIESAIQMEALQLAAGQTGAPLLPAGELAGDLWLQVHGYEDARRAYMEASERAGPTLRIMSGLARVARRLNETAAACAAYRRLLDTWAARPGLPVEVAEARAYLGGCTR